ncbi:YtkA-like [Salinibacillus kushneri]|uniref:YtkA-like n=1 Tax=Salinibacillus kushneri TaxID=237682 RepID=A0A1I0DP68_9BACI|nr:FixH family protein [Salinibacillus kushneri]SET34012.1 YtkA-like [Salinibacillus kushneri]
MRKIICFFLLTLIFLVITGCGTQGESEEPSTSDASELKMLNVEIQLPEEIQVNKEVLLKAAVTLDEEKVTDADNVKFEIWKEGSAEENHEEIEGAHEKDGIYSISKTFQEKGTYYVIAHVTARGMHNMPKEEFTVTAK